MNDSSDESDKYSEQEVGIKEDDEDSKPASKKEEAGDDYSDQDEVGYESTPSQMKKQIDKQEDNEQADDSDKEEEPEDNYD
jgi:hypothetical protein